MISNLLFALPENYLDRGTEVGTNCPQPSADMKVGIEIIICVCQNDKPNTLIAYIPRLLIQNFNAYPGESTESRLQLDKVGTARGHNNLRVVLNDATGGRQLVGRELAETADFY